jgi:hypothetical protein
MTYSVGIKALRLKMLLTQTELAHKLRGLPPRFPEMFWKSLNG